MLDLSRIVNVKPGKKTDIRILAGYSHSEAKIFAVKVLPQDQSVVVASGWPGFKVVRWNADGSRQEGDGAVVDAPHVTYHPPGYWHLRAERSEPIVRGLVWKDPEPGWSHSPWLKFVSPRLSSLQFVQPREGEGKGITRWHMPVPRIDVCLCLVVDFLDPYMVANDPDVEKSKYVVAKDYTLRFRLGPVPEDQGPRVIFETRG